MNHAPVFRRDSERPQISGEQALRAIERLAAAPRGEPGARQRLIDQLSPDLVTALSPIIRASVIREVRRRTGARYPVEQETEDMVQAVLLTLFVGESSALAAWDPHHDSGLSLEGFVSFIAARQVDTILRSRRKNPWTEEAVRTETFDEAPISRAGPETVTGSRNMLLMVAGRLRARVSPLGMKVFDLLFLQDRSPDRVGAALGLRTPAVHTWRSRLSRAAREIVGELEGVRVPPQPAARRRP